MTRKLLLIMVCMLISDWANVLLKIGASRDRFGLSISKIAGIVSNPYLMAGFAAYALGMLLWLNVLAENRLSTATVLFSIHYVHLMLLSRFVFKEPISWHMWLGTLMIVGGVACFSWGRLAESTP